MLFTDPEGNSCFYQISWIKLKKVTFVNEKRHLRGTLFTIYKHFGDFVKCILRFCCKFSCAVHNYGQKLKQRSGCFDRESAKILIL